MRIFMFVNYTPSDRSIGITKKISSEIKALRELGHEVFYTAYINHGVGVFDDSDNLIYKRSFLLKFKALELFGRYFLLINTCNSYFDNNNPSFDLFYGRLSAPNNQFMNLLRNVKNRGCKVYFESLAYFPGMKFKSIKGKYIVKMMEKNGPKFRDVVDKFLTEGDFSDFYGVKAESMKMGVETSSILPHCYIGSKDELNLISVSNETSYHAYDRLIRSLKSYYDNGGQLTVNIHLVGTVLNSTKKLIDDLSLQDRVVVYGKQFGKNLDSIYDKCNMGVGPLGQHRIGGKKDTGLKTKEYFAKGLPYFYSGQEMKELENYKYVYQVSADELLININELWNFYCSYKDDENVVKEMRLFSINNFSWKAIMEKAIM